MTAKEILELSPVEIETRLRDTRAELLLLRLKKNTGQVEKPHMLRSLRKDVARLLTRQSQKSPAPAAAVATR
jgi:large subunit ribosomal protein L29